MKTSIIPPAASAAAGLVCVLFISGTAYSDNRHASWSAAAPLPRTDGLQVPGGCPSESPTGRFLYTARNPSGVNLDIFVNEWDATMQAYQPGNALPGPVNDPAGADDFCPTPLQDGELFFVSRRDGDETCGAADLYVSVQNPATGWSEPQNLGCDPFGPNTPGTELTPSVIETPAGTFLFFSTDYYTGNQDIYRSRMRDDGSFEPGVRLPWPVNTEYDDRQPNVSQDGKEIVFASDRRGDFDIFFAEKRFVRLPWRRVENLSESVPFDTLDANETRPALSWDGQRLVYGSGGVWISERD